MGQKHVEDATPDVVNDEENLVIESDTHGIMKCGNGHVVCRSLDLLWFCWATWVYCLSISLLRMSTHASEIKFEPPWSWTLCREQTGSQPHLLHPSKVSEKDRILAGNVGDGGGNSMCYLRKDKAEARRNIAHRCYWSLAIRKTKFPSLYGAQWSSGSPLNCNVAVDLKWKQAELSQMVTREQRRGSGQRIVHPFS